MKAPCDDHFPEKKIMSIQVYQIPILASSTKLWTSPLEVRTQQPRLLQSIKQFHCIKSIIKQNFEIRRGTKHINSTNSHRK